MDAFPAGGAALPATRHGPGWHESGSRVRHAPVAVIGLGCRFPSGAGRGVGPDKFWQMLRDGREAVRAFPADRLGSLFYDPQPGKRGRTHAVSGHFIDGLEDFDPDFFGIAPREAQFIDPAHRILLETTWEALEDAGTPADGLAGTRTGVFVGICGTDFQNLQLWSGQIEDLEPYSGPGNLHSMACGRLSHALDLQGPAMSIDTACSSSLVALHLAAESLRREECDLAIVGGVNVLLSPDVWVNLSLAQMISGDGRCKTFDSRADGYGRGEGCGVLVLKRADDATADGDRVLALVRGSAVKHDGRSASITAPNGLSQRAVIREALDIAGITPEDVDYLEAHGTGTPLGDAIEIAALTDVFKGRSRRPLLVGSVKTNIGHLEAAAGVAGLIKAMLCLQHGEITPHLNLRELNPHIDLGTSLRIPTAVEPWPADGPRLAGVNAFGLSGTNAHVLLQAPPVLSPEAAEPARERPVVLTVSARTPTALGTLARRYAATLAEGQVSLADAARTANTGRARLACKAAIVASDAGEARAALSRIADDGGRQGDPMVAVGSGGRCRLAFLYAGQGTLRAGAGRGLFEEEPVFGAAIEECAALLRPHLDVPLTDTLFWGDEAGQPLQDTRYAQPALFAFEYALTALWRELGVEPDAVLGHSVGAYAAACAAGVFDLATAAGLVAQRGRLMQERTAPGAMSLVLAEELAVADALDSDRDLVTLAAVNAPQVVTISGEPAAVKRVTDRLAASGVVTRPLRVTRAFHSPLMDPVLGAFEQVLETATPSPPRLAFVSDRTGQFADSAELGDPSYWSRHIREPVRFADGVRTLLNAGCTVFAEIGPGATLTGFTRRGGDLRLGAAVPSLSGRGTAPYQVQQALADLYAAGVAIDLQRYHRGRPGRLIRLPGYPFERTPQPNAIVERGRDRLRQQSCQPGAAANPVRIPGRANGPHQLPDGGLLAEQYLSAREPGGAGDHKLFGAVVVPGAAWLAAAAHASWTGGESRAAIEISDVVFTRPLVLSGSAEHLAQCFIAPNQGLQIRSAEITDGRPRFWTTHATATVRPVDEDALAVSRQVTSAATVLRPEPEHADAASFYERAADQGLTLGPSFQWIHGLDYRDGHCRATLVRPETVDDDSTATTGFLDACLQAIASALPGSMLDELAARGLLLVPFTIDRVLLARLPVRSALAMVELLEVDDSGPGVIADIAVHDDSGQLVALLRHVRLAAVGSPAITGAATPAPGRFALELQPVTVAGAAATLEHGSWLVAGTSDGFTSAVADELTGRRAHCVRLLLGPGGGVLHQPDGSTSPFPMGSSDAWQRLAGVVARESEPLRGVVYCANDASPGSGKESPGSGKEANPPFLPELLALLRGWGDVGAAPVWLITRGAHPGGRGGCDPGQAAAAGLLRTLAAESPAAFGGVIDLDTAPPIPSGEPAGPDDEPAMVVDILAGGTKAPQLVRRLGGWLAPRLHAVTGPGGTASPIRGDAGYLITGGLGGVGRCVARWLLEQGAGAVVLNGRSQREDTRIRGVLNGLDPGGRRVRYVGGDVADPVLARRVVDEASAGGHCLKGVVHAAGVLDDAVLSRQDWPRFCRVFAPKARGGWNLHLATADLDLDLFVLCSSVAGLLGTPGQANYAAANAFLDALAAFRRHLGLPAVSIAWGPWSGTGMVDRAGSAELLRSAGLRPMSQVAVLADLPFTLTAAEPAVAIVDADWESWCRAVPSRAAAELLADLTQLAARADQGGDAELLLTVPVAERRQWLVEDLRGRLAETMGTVPPRVAVDVSLTRLGLDSLMGLDLKNRVEAAFGVATSAAFMLRGPTLEELADHILDSLAVTSEPAQPGPELSMDPGTLLERLDDLGDAELDALLSAYATGHDDGTGGSS